MQKEKFDCQTWNTKVIIDVKGKNAFKYKIFEAVNLTLYEHWYFFIYTQLCTISKYFGINKENEICLPIKKCISGHTNMAAKCEIFINCQKNQI